MRDIGYQEISHFRAPYKNAYMAGFGAVDQASWSAIADLVPTDQIGSSAFEYVLKPAAGIVLAALLQKVNYVVFTTAADKEQIVIGSPSTPPAAGQSAMDWVNAKLAKGRSVIISTNDPGGLNSIIAGTMTGQTMLVSVSAKADEMAVVGNAAPVEVGTVALIAPSKLHTTLLSSAVSRASAIGPVGVAVVALAGAGLIYYVVKGRKGRRA